MKLFFNFSALAHNTGQPHSEIPASVDPLVAIGALLILAIGGFILWRFVLKSPAKPVGSVEKKTEFPSPSGPSVAPAQPDNSQQVNNVKTG